MPQEVIKHTVYNLNPFTCLKDKTVPLMPRRRKTAHLSCLNSLFGFVTKTTSSLELELPLENMPTTTYVGWCFLLTSMDLTYRKSNEIALNIDVQASSRPRFDCSRTKNVLDVVGGTGI